MRNVIPLPLPKPPVTLTNIPCPGETRNVVPDTLADIWSMPKKCKDFWGGCREVRGDWGVVGYLFRNVHHPRRLSGANAGARGALTSAQTKLRQPLQRLSLIRFCFQRSPSCRRALRSLGQKTALPTLGALLARADCTLHTSCLGDEGGSALGYR